jgi:hypothetical protein
MLRRVEFTIGEILPEEAREIQYTLGVDVGVYRAFIDPYKKRGHVVFDSEREVEGILSTIGHGAQITREEELPLTDLIAQSLNK